MKAPIVIEAFDFNVNWRRTGRHQNARERDDDDDVEREISRRGD